jgi:hypothetical protein
MERLEQGKPSHRRNVLNRNNLLKYLKYAVESFHPIDGIVRVRKDMDVA